MRVLVIKYLKLWKTFFLNCLTRELEFKFNFLGNLLIDSSFYISQYFFFHIIFSYVDSLGEFKRDEQGNVIIDPETGEPVPATPQIDAAVRDLTDGMPEDAKATVEEMRSFSFAYIEKYAPSKQQLKTYLLKIKS